MKKQKLTNILLFVIGTELVGALSGIVAGGNFSAVYKSLVKPPFAPPGWLFPAAWAILYALMGYSAYLIYSSEHTGRRTALVLFGLQLFFNFLWSPVFFGLQSFAGATAVILVMLVLIIAMMRRFSCIRKQAALLNIPYLLWSIYAAYLTIGIMLLN